MSTLVSTASKGRSNHESKKLACGVFPSESLPPRPAHRRRRKMRRRNRMRRSKVDLRDLTQNLRAFFGRQFLSRGFHFRRDAATQLQPERFALSIQPANERLPRKDRRRCHRYVRFGFRPLFDVDLAAVLHQRAFNYAGVGKLMERDFLTKG